MLPVLISRLDLISCHKSNLFNANRTCRRAFMPPGNRQGIKKGPHSYKQSSFRFTKFCPDGCWRLMRGWTENSNETGAFMPPHKKDIQRRAISPIQFGRDRKGRCLCILRLQSNYILYIQTNVLEKLKGWHSQSWMWVVTTLMERDACLDSILVYVQIQMKGEGDGSSPLYLTKKNLNWRWWGYRQERPVSVQMLQLA